MASNLKNDPYYKPRNSAFGQSAEDDVTHRYDQIASEVQHQIQDKPVSSVAVAVGVGIGAGLLLSSLLTSERAQKERFARRVGNYLSNSGNLRSSIENLIPNSISDRYFS